MYEDDSLTWRKLFGAVAGSILGMLLWTLAGYFGVTMSVLSALISLGTIWGYLKMGGSLDKQRDCIFCLIIVLIAVYCGEHLAWAIQLHSALIKNGYEITRTACIRHLFTFLNLLELKGDFIWSTIKAYLFAMIGSIWLVLGAAVKDNERN